MRSARLPNRLTIGIWIGWSGLLAQGVSLASPLALKAQSTVLPGTTVPPGAARRNATNVVLRFSDDKPVIGLPSNASRSHVQCDSLGTTFFGVQHDASLPAVGEASLPVLYGLAEDGALKRVARKAPLDAASVSLLDFFVADHTLVSLLEADGRSGDDSQTAARSRRYLLSLSDHDGDGATLVDLSARFKPLKVAMFGSGDFLLLGWDELNLQPVLALVKGDGSVRRFFDLESPQARRDSSGHAQAASTLARKPLPLLQDAVFVPWERNVLLTFPGTREAPQVWTELGAGRTIPLDLPAGTVLHDVLVSGGGGTVVVRAQPVPPAEAKGSPPPPLRLLEFNKFSGTWLRELTLEVASPSDVLCAVRPYITAMFLDTLPDARSAAANVTAPDQPAERPSGW